MKKILWISRHSMSTGQLADLGRVMGGTVSLIPWQKTLEDPKELLPELEACDAVAAVLPPELLAKLLKLAQGKPVLRSVSQRLPTGRTVLSPAGLPEPEFSFVHLGWEQVLRVEIVTKKL